MTELRILLTVLILLLVTTTISIVAIAYGANHPKADPKSVQSRERSLQCQYGGGYPVTDAEGYYDRCFYPVEN